MEFWKSTVFFLFYLTMAELMFLPHAKRHPDWPKRLALPLPALVLFAVLWPTDWGGLADILKYLFSFLLFVPCIYALLDCTIVEAFYQAGVAYLSEHIATVIVLAALYNVFPFFDFGIGVRKALWGYAFDNVFYFVVHVLVYALIYLFCIRRITQEGFSDLDKTVFACFYGIVLLFVVVLSSISALYIPTAEESPARFLLYLYDVVGCTASLFVQSELQRRSRLSRQLQISEQLLYHQQQQYQISKENIDTINLKCHNLKHLVAALRHSMTDGNAQDALLEIESATQIYDSAVRTGNPALDVILTEKSLYCKKHQIQLTCIVDRAEFPGVSDIDLYSIFGNLLDNAVESVMELVEPEKRVIGLSITTKGNMAVIHTENYFDHPVAWENGLPVTTKEDKRFHGYGMKSIRLLAERYGGTLSVQPDGEIFNVDFILPLAADKTA